MSHPEATFRAISTGELAIVIAQQQAIEALKALSWSSDYALEEVMKIVRESWDTWATLYRASSEGRELDHQKALTTQQVMAERMKASEGLLHSFHERLRMWHLESK